MTVLVLRRPECPPGTSYLLDCDHWRPLPSWAPRHGKLIVVPADATDAEVAKHVENLTRGVETYPPFKRVDAIFSRLL